MLYGIISGFVSGIADAPSGMAGMFSTTHERRLHHKHDWKKARPPPCFDEPSLRHHRRTKSSLDSGVGPDEIPNNHRRPGQGHEGRYEADSSRDPSTSNDNSRESTESDEAYHSAEEDLDHDVSDDASDHTDGEGSPESSSRTSSSDTLDDPDGTGAELDLERTITRLRTREMSHTKEILAETSYHSARAAKHILDWALMLPTDLTLSLSKGFHNAPKLYHDRLVENTPKVLGFRSGFRAAGTVFTLFPLVRDVLTG